MKAIRFTIPRAVLTALFLFSFMTMGCDQQTPVSETAADIAPVRIFDTAEELNAAIATKAVPKVSLDESFREFQESIDWKRHMKKIVVEVRNGKKEMDMRNVLTEAERAAVQRFYVTTFAWNKAEFESQYGGSFVRLLSEHPEAISCTDFKNDDAFGKLPGPCDVECAGMIVAMGGMFLSTGSLVGATFGIAGFVFAADAVSECLDENNMDSCW